MNVNKITNELTYIGYIDHDLKVFDIVMETEYGSSYNSYLIKDEDKTVLIETVKYKFIADYLKLLKDNNVEIKDIDYIVVNHTEPDHSGSIEYLIEQNPLIKIVGSRAAINYLGEIINRQFESITVKTGDSLKLSNKTLEFHFLPNLHWPDSMYTHLVEDNILFTCDSFGSHFAHDGLFLSKLSVSDNEKYLDSIKKYYDPIFSPFKKFVLKGIEVVEKINPSIICTGHGPIIDTRIDEIVGLYKTWSTDTVNEKPKVLSLVTSAYGYTQEITTIINNEMALKNYDTELINVDVSNYNSLSSEIYSKINKTDILILGAATIVKDAVSIIYNIVGLLNQTVNKNLKVFVVGSYGWSGEAVKNIDAVLRIKKINTGKSLMLKFKPSNSNIDDIKKYSAYIDAYFKAKDFCDFYDNDNNIVSL